MQGEAVVRARARVMVREERSEREQEKARGEARGEVTVGWRKGEKSMARR